MTREPWFAAPSEHHAPAFVCSVDGCSFGVTVEGTESWPETLGLSVETVRCREHGDSMVRGWLDRRTLWR